MDMRHFLKPLRRGRAFTLVELLLSMSVLAIIMVLMADVVVRTQNTMSQATAHVGEFQEARAALDAVSSSLSQAVMDASWSYKRNAAGAATGYERVSDHHFILGPASDLVGAGAEAGQAMFFQAPLGFAGSFTDVPGSGAPAVPGTERLHALMNAWGFYVKYDTDLAYRPGFLKDGTATKLYPERKRFRLMQYSQPAEKSILYSKTFALNRKTAKTQALQWYQTDLVANSRPVAENILAMILVPYSANVTVTNSGEGYSDVKVEPDPLYAYDTRDFQWNGSNAVSSSRRHQLPPKVLVTLFASEEKSYDKYVANSGDDEDAAAQKVRDVFKGRFAKYSDYEKDMTEVEKALGGLGLHFKALNATVTLRSGKWITEVTP